MSWALRGISAAVLSATLATAATEAPYAFRQRLVTVHRQDRRDFSLRPAADELEIADGARIVVSASAPALVVHAARDFQDYLLLSMGVNASVLAADATVRDRDALDGIPGIAVALDASLGRGYAVETSVDGVRIAALNERPEAAPQGILKNVRRAVDDFVGDAPQFDDLTMLCLEYKGVNPAGRKGNDKP